MLYDRHSSLKKGQTGETGDLSGLAALSNRVALDIDAATARPCGP